MGIKRAELRQPDLLLGQIWRGHRARYKYICSKHGEYSHVFKNHYDRNGCRKCIVAHIKNKLIYQIEDVEKKYPDLVKGQTWSGARQKYKFKCSIHGFYFQNFSNHTQGYECPKCGYDRGAAKQKLTTVDFERRCRDAIKGQKWINAHTKYRFLCNKHGEYRQPFNVHVQGVGCSRCSESHGEKEIHTILTKLNIAFNRQKRFENCRNSKPLPFDFFLSNHRTLIEFHGSQHYEIVLAWGGRRALQRTQRHDRIKRLWCRRNKYRLIVVPYTIKNVKNYLFKKLGLTPAQEN